MAWTTPSTWTAGQNVSAANLNAQIRDNLNALSTWTAYTPTWTGTGGTPTLGNGTLAGVYMQWGDVLHVRVDLTWGSTTSAAGITVWRFSLPGSSVSSGLNVLSARVLDSSTNIDYSCTGFASAGATTIGATSSDTGNVGIAKPIAWATSDRITIQGTIRL